MNLRRIVIGVAACLALALALLALRWLFPPFPDEQQVMALYATHRQEFTLLSEMTEKHCAGQPMPKAAALASRIDRRARVVCDYDGTLRFILGVRGLLTVGPERIIGLTCILGDPARKGTVVPALGPFKQQIGGVYLRHLDGRWYVFTQNTE